MKKDRPKTDESPSRVGNLVIRLRADSARHSIAGWSFLACCLFFVVAIQAEESKPRPSAEGTAGGTDTGKVRRLPEGLNFANGLFRRRNFELAAEEYERFLQTNPAPEDAIDAQFGLANARLFQKRYQDAQGAFRRFLESAPNHPRARSAWYRLGEVSYLLGDLAESRRALDKFTEGDANHPNLETAWTYLGDVCFALRDLCAAKRAYETGLKAFPRGALADRARYGLGRSLAGLGQPDAALKDLEELVKSGKRDWVDRAWMQIGSIHMTAGRYDRAVEAYENLEKDAPNSLLRSEAGLHRGEALVKLKRPEEAVPLLKALAEDPGQAFGPQAALALATIYLEEDKNQEAVDAIGAAVKRFPNSPIVPSLTFRQAEALSRLNQLDEARSRFLQVAEKSPGDPLAESAMLRAIKLAFNAKNFEEARKLTASYVSTFPKSTAGPELQLMTARALRAEKKGGDAIPILEKLLATSEPGTEAVGEGMPGLKPELAREARYELALAYREGGQKDKADEAFALLANKAGGKPGEEKPAGDAITADAQFLVGQNALEAGKFRESIGPLEGYLESNPNGEVANLALSHLVTARIGLGEIDAAAKAIDQLIARSPAPDLILPARLRLAEAALAAKRYDLAETHFRWLAQRHEPVERARVQAGLGQVLWNLKKPAEAAIAFGEALSAAPDDPTAPEIAFAHARALEAAEQFDQALDAYTKLAGRYEKSSQVVPSQLARARLLTKAGKPAESSAIYDDLFKDQTRVDLAVASGVKLDALMADWGWSLVDAGKIWEADKVFNRLLKDFPDGEYAADARFNLAESANSAHNFAEVVRLLKPLAEPGAKVSPRLLPDVLYRLGRTEIALSEWKEAAPVLDRLIGEFPNSPRRAEARLFRAEVALQLNDAAGALANLTSLQGEVDSLNDAHSKQFKTLIQRRTVQCLLALKKWDEVIARADSVKAELPKGDSALAELDFARGRAFQGLAKMNEARDAYQAVIDARKGSDLAAQARFMRGETFFHEEKYGEARREFLMVDTLHVAPKWQAAAILEVGKIYERLEQWSEAVHYYEMVISKFPSDPHAAEAKGSLQAAVDRSKASGRRSTDPLPGERKEDISARVRP